MKKLYYTAFFILPFIFSCSKDDQTGIPPVIGITAPTSISTENQEQTLEILEAHTATINQYQAGKKVKIHGKITIKNHRSYFKFQDDTLIQIFSRITLSAENKTKLLTENQEVTITGTFTDYTPKNSNVIVKEIVFQQESDIVFGETPTNTPLPEPTDIPLFIASENTISIFEEGKKVKLQGTLQVETTAKGGKNLFFILKDNEKIQLWSDNFKNISQEIKTKLNTENQSVTIIGTFSIFNKKKQIKYVENSDIIFENNATNSPSETPTSENFIFDFENVTSTGIKYDQNGEISVSNATLIYEKVRTDSAASVNGTKGILLNENSVVKLTFSNGVKTLSLKYKGKFKKGKKRTILIRDNEGNILQKSPDFSIDETGEISATLNKTGNFTLSIHAEKETIAIDEITFTK